MKKLLIFALMLVCCLSFAACGGDSEQEAVDAVGGQDGPSVSTVGAPNIKDVPKDAYGRYDKDEVEAALPLFCGTWQGYLEHEGQSAEIRADGTCTVLGEELTWVLRIFDAEDGNYVRLDTFRGKDEAYTLRVEDAPLNWGEGSYRQLRVINKAETVPLYDAAQVVEVEVTAANWNSYMEVINYTLWNEDAFGEATDVCFNTAWNMKDAYADRLIDAAIVCEHSFDRAAVYSASVDLATLSLSIGGPTEPTFPDGTPLSHSTEPLTAQFRFSGDFNNKGISDNPAYEALNLVWTETPSFSIESGWIAPAANFTVTRAEGSLLLLK